jgi:tripartite-type tricarboxylate transporter receptor subunit TctC
MSDAGMLASSSASPGDFKAFLAAETAKWQRVVKETGAKLE